jgi:hypothetical protein
VHLAAQHGHGQVLEVRRSYQARRISSKKLGVTALHVAAYFGQAGAYIFSGRVDRLEHVLYYLSILSEKCEKHICEHSGR